MKRNDTEIEASKRLNTNRSYIKTVEDRNLTKRVREAIRRDGKGRCINAFEVLSDPRILRDAYETIKGNPGNMVRGTDHITLDGISEEWFEAASRNLRRESYRPKPARRVYIPKPNGKLRPIGISSPRDKIVQQAMRIVLEVILEPTFSDSSHGFRPGRGCHSALNEIRK